MTFSDEEFIARVTRRCEEVGRSQRAVLKEAGCAHDYLQTTPTHGRRIDRVAKIAEVLQIPLANLLGLPSSNRIEVDLLLLAYQGTQEATKLVQHPDAASFVKTMATLYTLLLDRQAQGKNPADPEFLRQVIEVLQAGAAIALPG